MTRWKKELEQNPTSVFAREWNAADYDGDGNIRFPARESVYRYGWSYDRCGFGILNDISRFRREKNGEWVEIMTRAYDARGYGERVAKLPG